MIVDFYVYDSIGRIVRTGTAPSDHIPLQAGSGETAVEGMADSVLQYYDSGTSSLADRPPSPVTVNKSIVAADGYDTVTFSNVPVSSTVVVSGPAPSVSVVVTDGVLDLTFTQPGRYVVRFDAFPHLDKEFVIDAT